MPDVKMRVLEKFILAQLAEGKSKDATRRQKTEKRSGPRPTYYTVSEGANKKEREAERCGWKTRSFIRYPDRARTRARNQAVQLQTTRLNPKFHARLRRSNSFIRWKIDNRQAVSEGVAESPRWLDPIDLVLAEEVPSRRENESHYFGQPCLLTVMNPWVPQSGPPCRPQSVSVKTGVC